MMMGATKKKRGLQKGYVQGVLDEAVQMIQMGRMLVRKASILYQILKSTLSDHSSGHSMTQRKGPQPYLPKDVEDWIVHRLAKMAQIGYGQTKESLLNKVQEIIGWLNIPTPWEDGRPSRHWYELFMKWNPQLKLWQAQLSSCERVGVSHAGLSHWYQELYDYLLSMGNLEILQLPIQIFNCDETGFPIAPKPPKVICETGAPNVYAHGSLSKQMITTLLCASAAGMYVRPMIIYPGTNFRKDFMTKFLWAYSRWWIWTFSEFCDEKNIILYVLYLNSTHLTQPLDLSLMGLVKVHYKEAVQKWISEKPIQDIW